MCGGSIGETAVTTENGSDDEEVQVSLEAPEPSPKPMAHTPRRLPKSAPALNHHPYRRNFQHRVVLPVCLWLNALFTATSAIDSPGYPPLSLDVSLYTTSVEVESGPCHVYSVVNGNSRSPRMCSAKATTPSGASVVLTDPEGNRHLTDMHQVEPTGLDIWKAQSLRYRGQAPCSGAGLDPTLGSCPQAPSQARAHISVSMAGA